MPSRLDTDTSSSPLTGVTAPADASSLVSAQSGPLLDEILRTGAVHMVFQALVEMATGTIVGYEALARGPKGSALERPDHLFAAARRADRLAELDWACRAAALTQALDAGLPKTLTLFVNAEPEVLAGPVPSHLLDVIERASRELSVVVEVTERALAARPAELLRAADTIRSLGWSIALDDVGAEMASLALMPFLRPSVIKLDLRLVQDRPTLEIAEIVSAVYAEAERTGAHILAEGIETDRHAATALAMGATLGQGWLLGRPAPLPSPLPTPSTGLAVRSPSVGGPSTPTPFELASATHSPRLGDKRLLIAISKHLEQQARELGGTAVILAALQDARFLTPQTIARYADLVAGAAFVGLLGAGLTPEPVPDVRGAVLAADDALRSEWDIAVVGPHFAGTLLARDLGDDGPDLDRRFEFVLTYDREVAVGAASSLMSRIWPTSGLADGRGDGQHGGRKRSARRSDRGVVVQNVGAQTDGTARVQMEQALTDERDLTAALLAAIDGPSLVVGHEGCIERANEEACRVLARTETALRGRQAQEVLGAAPGRRWRSSPLEGPGAHRRTLVRFDGVTERSPARR